MSNENKEAISVVSSDVAAKLAEYGIDESTSTKIVEELGVDNIDDLSSLEVTDLTNVGVKLAKARKLLNDLKQTKTTTSAEPLAIQTQFETLLPSIPSDESWLNALKTGGVLKVDDSSYIAAIRATVADVAGLYDVPKILLEAMEKYADETEEQVDPIFYSLRKSLTRHTYGDIFAAIDGLDGTFVTQNRRNEFLARVEDELWTSIVQSFETLNNWYQAWRANFSDPSMLIAAVSGNLNGTTGMSMIAPPDTAPLHDVGDDLIDSINGVFRGTGVQIAAAMAYDASMIRNTLEDKRLPALVGTKNREMMLKKLGVNIDNDYIRLEQNLVKYVLAFTRYSTVASDLEASYFAALWQLGNQISWSKLTDIQMNDDTADVVDGRFL